MTELARKYDFDEPSPLESPENENTEPASFNLLGGNYFDPDIGAVNYHNQKLLEEITQDASDEGRTLSRDEAIDANVEMTVKTALAWTGIIPYDKELFGPLEKSNRMPYKNADGEIIYSADAAEESTFTGRRADQLIDDFAAKDQAMNELVLRIKRAIQLRRGYSEEQKNSLYDFAKTASQRGHKDIPVLRMVNVMVGGSPEDQERDRIKPLFEESYDLAPDVVLMLIREDQEKGPQ